MGYDFDRIEKKWQKYWSEHKTFKADINHDKPKFYVLDMFPYPSGAGLHVGHPLGYIASDIYSRFKRHQGFNVLHPMGYDAYGLPAEQYAIQTGTHPEITTEKNILRYREQLDKIGFSFDWDREVRTSDPEYYRWTQWTFIRLFHSWYNKKTDKAEDISALITHFEINGNAGLEATNTCEEIFTAEFWNNASEKEQQQILMHYRLAYLSETMVNWCPELGTVLANDEVKEGLSERGGHPVEKKLMMQWSLRITAYAQRLLDGLETVDWSEPIKEMQRNWIGRSEGASVDFEVWDGDESPKVLPFGEDLGGVIEGTGNTEDSNNENDPENTPGYYGTDKGAWFANKDYVRELRKNPTDAEALLWENVRKDRIGYRIRRQHAIEAYIVDFVCLSKKTIIELDGDIHDYQAKADKLRTETLEENGYSIIRFKNSDVNDHLEEVIKTIKTYLDNKIVEDLKVLLFGEDLGGVKEGTKTTEERYKGDELITPPHPSPKGREQIIDYNLNESTKVLPFGEDLGGVNEAEVKTTDKGDSFTPPLPIAIWDSPEGREQITDKNLNESTKVLPLGEDIGGVNKPNQQTQKITVFTTRPDTLFGATFMVLAPEHELVSQITSASRREKVEAYVSWAKNRSERERMTEVKNISGEFTGAYGVNPLTGGKLPIWIADYVLSGYGTGAIMAVPGHDSRDFAFARHFDLPIIQVVVKEGEEPTDPATWDDSIDSKEGVMVNSGFITGMKVKEAIITTINKIQEMGIGYGTINFRLHDAIFSRQRYWGEPFPIYYKDGMPYTLDESGLPLKLPQVESYLPTEQGDPPLAALTDWKTKEGYPLETNTMPGFAGSSGYYLRYMDPQNKEEYFSAEANQYWRNVDLYVGGDEHAAGHLIYSRFWNKFLYDLGMACEAEPFKKLINQGKIQGRSSFVYRIPGTNKFVSHNLRKDYDTQRLHVDIDLVENDVLNTKGFKAWREEYKNAEFILEEGKYICGWEVEKMSKSKHNVQNPDALIEKYGADTLRLYEMFLGPLEQDKPWDTNGIEGVFRFLKRLWRLYFDNNDQLIVTNENATKEELKVLHKTIKKIHEDIERFSFNTGVSAFMICVNELMELNCHKREILEPLALLIEPYAPHVAEELWQSLGHTGSISTVDFPQYVEKYLAEASFQYPVSFNGKMRFKLDLPMGLTIAEIEKAALESDEAKKWMEGKPVRKVIIVPNRIINIVI
ncbi:MAG: hypothetical protein A2W85_12830 [Bacteroidetes bacterium GWF2_41_31]|nr:MAG: hypothetical protein A2W85_12830 [Bacteroidetes bacterium GWF2_41_31]